MKNDFPLQLDTQFRKLRFRHSEKLSKEVFDLMEQGRIYPHEGLMDFSDLLDELRNATHFSRESFDYAFSRNGYFIDKEECMSKILKTELNGTFKTVVQDQHLY